MTPDELINLLFEKARHVDDWDPDVREQAAMVLILATSLADAMRREDDLSCSLLCHLIESIGMYVLVTQEALREKDEAVLDEQQMTRLRQIKPEIEFTA